MNNQEKKCPECAAPMKSNSKFCGKCGTEITTEQNFSQPKKPVLKTKAAATLWGIFLGGFGAHKFYMGSKGWGWVYLVLCWTYIPFLVAMVEWVKYVRMTDDEFYSKAENFTDKGAFGFFW